MLSYRPLCAKVSGFTFRLERSLSRFRFSRLHRGIDNLGDHDAWSAPKLPTGEFSLMPAARPEAILGPIEALVAHTPQENGTL